MEQWVVLPPRRSSTSKKVDWVPRGRRLSLSSAETPPDGAADAPRRARPQQLPALSARDGDEVPVFPWNDDAIEGGSTEHLAKVIAERRAAYADWQASEAENRSLRRRVLELEAQVAGLKPVTSPRSPVPSIPSDDIVSNPPTPVVSALTPPKSPPSSPLPGAAVTFADEPASSKTASKGGTSMWAKHKRRLTLLRTLVGETSEHRVPVDDILPYVARETQRWIVHGRAGSGLGPAASRTSGVVLCSDISGWTSLSAVDDLTAAQLAAFLNDFMGRLIQRITAAGGDVVKFAGDGLVAVWSLAAFPDHSLGQLVAAVVACAVRANAELRDFAVRDGLSVSLHSGVACGELEIVHCGGLFGRWEAIVGGQAVLDGASAEQAATQGQVVVAAAVAALMPDLAVERTARDGFLLVVGDDSPPSEPVAPAPVFGDAAVDPASLAPDMMRAVPAAVKALGFGSGGLDLLSETRAVSVLFFRVDAASLGTFARPEPSATASAIVGDARLRAMQDLLESLQTHVYAAEGSLNKVLIDADGALVCVAVFGLPPLPHADDALRAVRTVLGVSHTMAKANASWRAGIATGRVFCGAVGSELRREYAVIGSTVNLAARLMAKAKANGALVDERTRHATQTRIIYRAPLAVELKGFSAAVAAHEPQRLAFRQHSVEPSVVDADGQLEHVLALVQARLDGSGGVVLLDGTYGVGKSRMLAWLADNYRLRAGACLDSRSVDARRLTSRMRGWAGIVCKMLGTTFGLPATPDVEAHVASFLAPEDSDLAALVNGVVPHFALPESARLASMSKGERKRRLTELLVAMLAQLPKPALLLLDDSESMDADSWELLAAAVAAVDRLVVCIALAPMVNNTPVQLTELRADVQRTETVRLHGLDAPAICGLMAQVLGVELSATTGGVEDACRFVSERTDGVPRFVLDLLQSLVADGQLAVEDGHVRLDADGDVGDVLQTIEARAMAQIDRLPPMQQHIVRMAAQVDADAFTKADIDAAVHSSGTDSRLAGVHWNTLIGSPAIFLPVPATEDDDGADARFRFRSRLTRQTLRRSANAATT